MKLIGVGGEASVFDLGKGRALKLFKDSKHPDIAGDTLAMAAADARIDEHQRKLPAMLKRTWPVEMVAPLDLHHKNARIDGYIMPLVKGTPIARGGDDDLTFSILRALHVALANVHKAGVVIGDLNPFNILVDKDRVRLIDSDSAQFDTFKCALFTERYTDPLAYASGQLKYEANSDWYTFAALVLECLTGLHVYGGVHPTLLPSQRVARNVTVFDSSVKLPRAARPLSDLPAPLLAYLREVFVDRRREPFPELLLERLALAPLAAPVIVASPGVDVSPATLPIRQTQVRNDHGQLYNGTIYLGDALEGSQIWHTDKLGAGFYRAGDKPVAFLFALSHRALNDSLVLPRMPAILDAHALVSDTHATFVFYVRDGATLRHHAIMFDKHGRRVAEDRDAAPGILGAAAIDDALLVPTDEGVVRLDKLREAARFPATKELVHANTRLHIGEGGLIVETSHGTFLVRLQGAKS